MSNPSGVTHCVMRRGASWFAFPAEMVREVLFRPPLLAVPHSDALLAGLCHVRSEFFPVLRLDTLLVDDPATLAAERQMLVLHGDEGPWAVLVDQVTALATLETSAAPEEDFQENWSEVVSGWAAHETQVVRVLDPQRFYSLADHLLCESWSRAATLPDASEPQQIGPAPSSREPQADPQTSAPDGTYADPNTDEAENNTTTPTSQDSAVQDQPQGALAPSQPGPTSSTPSAPSDPGGTKGK